MGIPWTSRKRSVIRLDFIITLPTVLPDLEIHQGSEEDHVGSAGFAASKPRQLRSS
jgi:hypothetical protein